MTSAKPVDSKPVFELINKIYEEELETGLKELPSLFKKDGKEEELYQLLHSKYDKNMDKMQLYAARNVFNFDESKICVEKDDELDEIHDNRKLQKLENYSKISSEEQQKINTELEELRFSLFKVKRRRELFEEHLHKVKAVQCEATKACNELQQAIQSSEGGGVENLQARVSEVAVIGRQGLEDVMNQGKRLMDTLLDGEGTNSHSERSVLVSSRRRRLSLKEYYASMRKDIKTGDIAGLIGKLKSR